MIEFMELTGPFAVTCRGEGWQCRILDTPLHVFAFLKADDGVGLGIDSDDEQITAWLNDENYWQQDDGGKPFEWRFDFGECASVTVTRITLL